MDQSELLEELSLNLDFTPAVSDVNVSLAPVSVHGRMLTDNGHTVNSFCNQEKDGFYKDKVSLPAMTENTDDDDLRTVRVKTVRDRPLEQTNIAYQQDLEGNISLKHPISITCESQRNGPRTRNLKACPFLEENNNHGYLEDRLFSETKLFENCTQNNGSMKNGISLLKDYPDYQVIKETCPGSGYHYVSPLTTNINPDETSELASQPVTAQDNETITYSDALIRENELELSKVKQLTLQQNTLIYKLAFDESFIDHPDEGEQEFSAYSNTDVIASPSPPTLPTEDEIRLQEDTDSVMTNHRQALEELDEFSRLRSEIIVHELDTVSEAGSEDVELIPHRYESQTAGQKHIYINKLTLAVELLRTKEVLPYDEELKPVPLGNQEDIDPDKKEENDQCGVLPEVHVYSSTGGAVNQSFVKEPELDDGKDPDRVHTLSSVMCKVKTSQPQSRNGEEIQKIERWVQASHTRKGYSVFGSSSSIQPSLVRTPLASARGLCCVTM